MLLHSFSFIVTLRPLYLFIVVIVRKILLLCVSPKKEITRLFPILYVINGNSELLKVYVRDKVRYFMILVLSSVYGPSHSFFSFPLWLITRY